MKSRPRRRFQPPQKASLGENLSRSGMKLFTPSLLSALILCIEKMHDIYNNNSSITMTIEYEYNYAIITIVEENH